MDTTRFIYNLMVQVEVTAPSESDANAIISDCFGEGPCGGAEVVSLEVLDSEELG